MGLVVAAECFWWGLLRVCCERLICAVGVMDALWGVGVLRQGFVREHCTN